VITQNAVGQKAHCLRLLSAGKMEGEVNPKKQPRLRKVNFSRLEESIFQRDVKKNFDMF
jgi:hypothetical protein